MPASFPELDRLSESELQYLQANSSALDDWLMDLPQVKACDDRLKRVREENCELACGLLARQAELEDTRRQCERGRAALDRRREAVEALGRQRDEILQQRAPERLGAVLTARAQEADAQAEALLQEALDSSVLMDMAALSEFRKSYVQQKAEKHWRLALKESL